ncbi:hypothetical protein ACFFQW_45650 [Umezawaea endophytica]|uniref:Uncharacterized protein n=1 Tax=Umezawaea endophytica TaxID=1654476 RepID=A0A9X2ZYG7_9PSEU|nr:hypothetical protein [Umezawaea endophytica]MCS7476444.1 hypothetical protein [Umezawaea endophytica]
MDVLEPCKIEDRSTDGTAYWPDVRLLLQGLRARAVTPRQDRAIRPEGGVR